MSGADAFLTPGLHLPGAGVSADTILDAASEHGAWIAVVPPVADKRSLLDALADILALPSWFGRNWDALEECLGDLDNLPPRPRVLVFDSLDDLPTADRRIAVELLAGAALRWARTATPLSVVILGGSGPHR